MRPKAFTLVEVLVTGALLLLVLAVLLAILVPTLRAWLRSDERSQVQQSALLVLLKLREEVRDAAPASLEPLANGLALASFGSKPEYAEGDLLWRKHVVVYLAEREVRSQDLPFPPGTAAPPFTTFTPRADDHLVTRNIRTLSCELTNRKTVHVRVEAELRGRVAVLESVLAPVMR